MQTLNDYSFPLSRGATHVDATGRWVGDQLYWDIDGETISDSKLKEWIRNNLPEQWQYTGGIVRNYHLAAYKHRREAIDKYMAEKL